MPTLIDIATLVVRKQIGRAYAGRATYTGVSINYALAVAMRYMRMFAMAVVLVLSVVHTAHAQTIGECTYYYMHTHCANVYTRIYEDMPGWDCRTMGNRICSTTQYPFPTRY